MQKFILQKIQNKKIRSINKNLINYEKKMLHICKNCDTLLNASNV